MASPRTAEETRALLDAADALTAFVLLEPEGVENFRQRYPKFVPDAWWTFKDSYGEVVWRAWQGLLAVSWVKLSIYSDSLLALLTMWSSTEPSITSTSELAGVFTPTLYPYQRAVLFLALEPWRMKDCQRPECGKPFIADHASRKYCSVDCSAQVIEQQHLKWGRENNWGREKPNKKSRRTR